MAGFHGVFQAAKYFSRRPTFRESVLYKLTLIAHRRCSHRDKQGTGNIRNHQEDSEKNKTELLKMKTIIVEIKKEKPPWGKERVN